VATTACDLCVVLGDLVATVTACIIDAPPLMFKKSCLTMHVMLALSVGSQQRAARNNSIASLGQWASPLRSKNVVCAIRIECVSHNGSNRKLLCSGTGPMIAATASKCFPLSTSAIQGQRPARKRHTITPNAHASSDGKEALSPRMRSGERT
jgi:hypothetical protein